MEPIVLTHGGAGAPASAKDGAEAAAHRGLEEDDALAMALAATCVLEDDPRFNAGTGANYRLDGETIELDASVMTSDGRSGAVACLERVQHPILVAARVRERTPHLLIAGGGATAFARRQGFPDYDPGTKERRSHLERARALLLQRRFAEPGFEAWQILAERDEVKALWNFSSDYPGDTVGAVTRDESGAFAATASTGGTLFTLRGRVGDSPLIGCGVFAGPRGAVACTGAGEEIVRRFLAKTVYDALARGNGARATIDAALAEIPAAIPMGILAVTSTEHAHGCNREMPVGVAARPKVAPAPRRG